MPKSLTDPTNQTEAEAAYWARLDRECAPVGTDDKVTCPECNGIRVWGYTLMDPECPVCKGAGRVVP